MASLARLTAGQAHLMDDRSHSTRPVIQIQLVAQLIRPRAVPVCAVEPRTDAQTKSICMAWWTSSVMQPLKNSTSNDLQLRGLWPGDGWLVVRYAGVMRYPDGGGLDAAER